MITTVTIVILAGVAGMAAGMLIIERKVSAVKETKAEAERQLSAKTAEVQLMQRQIQEQQARHDKEMRNVEIRNSRDNEERIEKLKQQITALTAQTLKTRSTELFSDNRQQLGEIVTPLKLLIDEVKQSINQSRTSYDKNTAALEEQLKHMCEATMGVGEKADRLSEALQSGPKVQGNFGEMKLEVMLSDFGFTKGVEYDVQETLRDENGVAIKNEDTGRKMIPDAILHYPDRRDVIIDSKVSLTAFIDYVNADNEDIRKIALQNHLRSINKHVEELADKEYYKYIPKSKSYLDYVIMFVPNESALVLALSADPMLWRRAFEHNVFITGEQNLFAVLQFLKIMWTQKLQSENHEKVYAMASQLVERVGDFMERYNDLGEKIKKVNEAYDNARLKVDGKQSIGVSATKLIEMGAKESPKHPLGKIEE